MNESILGYILLSGDGAFFRGCDPTCSLAYNYFCNKIQNSLNTQDRKYKYEIHKLTPKCFLSHIKHQILLEQALGPPNTWEYPNTPMYSIPTTLRTQSLLLDYAEGNN